MAVGMVLWAINGAAARVASTQGTWPKAKLATILTYLFLKEIAGTVLLFPSLSRSILIYSSLPSHSNEIGHSLTIVSKRRSLSLLQALLPWVRAFKVSVSRNVPYGGATRNMMDVYVPGIVPTEGGLQKLPVVMFVHGGSWASGSKELFAHLGAYLAHRGVITVLVQYTLFPEVLALQQVREVSQALTWIFDNIEHYGGDSQRVTLMGHSAGAHLCALSIWERFKTAHLLNQRLTLEAINCSSEPLPEIDGDYLYKPDVRQPHNFIGLAGVYDISEHLKHEQKRGVDSMSAMTPAMGGKHLFETMSPVHLFHNFMACGSAIYLRRKHDAMSASVDDVDLDDNASCSEVTDAGVSMSNCKGNGGMYVEGLEDIDVGSCPAHGVMQGMHHTLLPNCTLFCSSSDTVVRPDTSIAFHSALKELGHPSELIVFENLEHSNFIVLDGPLPDQASLRRHILQIVKP